MAEMRGRDRTALLINPADAARLGLVDGAKARVESAAGAVVTHRAKSGPPRALVKHGAQWPIHG